MLSDEPRSMSLEHLNVKNEILLILDVCTIYYIEYLSNYNEDNISYFMQIQSIYLFP